MDGTGLHRTVRRRWRRKTVVIGFEHLMSIYLEFPCGLPQYYEICAIRNHRTSASVVVDNAHRMNDSIILVFDMHVG